MRRFQEPTPLGGILKMGQIYGLIFDVDGVIADSEAVNVRATAKAFEDILGITGVTPEDFEAGIGRGAEEYVKAGARSHGREISPDEVKALVAARQGNFLAVLRDEELPAFPGVKELIDEAMASEPFEVAIATSSTREKSRSVLDSAKIPYGEMVYVCGDDISRKKPDPEVFQVACDRLKIPPALCVVIEDAPNGVEAAHAAGCKCIAVTNTCSSEALGEADMIVDSLCQVSLCTVLPLLRKS
jgi:HAD superfamily hydrolase (TIGR01509 family)